MADFLLKLLDNSNPENVKMFNSIRDQFFKQYSENNNVLTKEQLKMPLKLITKELYGIKNSLKIFLMNYVLILIKIIRDSLKKMNLMELLNV